MGQLVCRYAEEIVDETGYLDSVLTKVGLCTS
jgi:hypothetical protein